MPGWYLFCPYLFLTAPLRKHAYSNICRKFHLQNRKFSDKKSDIFHISAQNIDCGDSLEPPRRGGLTSTHNLCFLNRSKKNNVYPCKPQFYYIKVGFKGSVLYRRVFMMPSFGASGRASWLAFPGYLHLHVYVWAGWCESTHSAHVWRDFFAWQGWIMVDYWRN